MIEIEKPDNYRHGFPTIDFKFQNTGRSTAVLWKFTIDIVEAKVDVSPDLSFDYDIVSPIQSETKPLSFEDSAFGSVVISLKNDGWGGVRDFHAEIESPILNQLYSVEQRTFRGNIVDDKRIKIIRFLPPSIGVDQFKNLHSKLMSVAWDEIRQISPDHSETWFQEDWYHSRHREYSLMGYDFKEDDEIKEKELQIPFGNFKIVWHGLNENEQPCNSLNEASGPSDAGSLYLTENGFVYRRHVVCYSLMPSDTTYCAMINPDRGSHQRQYPISRMIPAGDVERFHILVGATKSCNLQIRFKFHLGKSTEICSETFNLKIWNPKKSWLSRHYRDGDEFITKIIGKYKAFHTLYKKHHYPFTPPE